MKTGADTTTPSRVSLEIDWLRDFVKRHNIPLANELPAFSDFYLEMSRHFETKREQRQTAREVRQWARLTTTPAGDRPTTAK
jgi:hypothetical protein